MKTDELRAAATCAICGHPFGRSGMPLFWRVTIERFGLNVPALQRQGGLEMMIGVPLASVMGPNEDLAEPVMDPVKVTICEDCSTSAICIAQLAEKA